MVHVCGRRKSWKLSAECKSTNFTDVTFGSKDRHAISLAALQKLLPAVYLGPLLVEIEGVIFHKLIENVQHRRVQHWLASWLGIEPQAFKDLYALLTENLTLWSC